MTQLHPNQSLHFNFLADRAAPRGSPSFSLRYASARDSLRFLLARYPDRPLRLYAYWPVSILTLPADLRQRIAFVDFAQADFALQLSGTDWRAVPLAAPYAPVLHASEAYGYPLIWTTALNLARVPDAVAAPYRAAYRDLQARVPIVRALRRLSRSGRARRELGQATLPRRGRQPQVHSARHARGSAGFASAPSPLPV